MMIVMLIIVVYMEMYYEDLPSRTQCTGMGGLASRQPVDFCLGANSHLVRDHILPRTSYDRVNGKR